MKSKKNSPGIVTKQEAILYIDDVLRSRTGKQNEQDAAKIVGLITNEHFHEWHNDDPDFEAILTDASDLEWSNGSPKELADMWQHINFHLERLKQRYLKND